jgi:hypothetical protein
MLLRLLLLHVVRTLLCRGSVPRSRSSALESARSASVVAAAIPTGHSGVIASLGLLLLLVVTSDAAPSALKVASVPVIHLVALVPRVVHAIASGVCHSAATPPSRGLEPSTAAVASPHATAHVFVRLLGGVKKRAVVEHASCVGAKRRNGIWRIIGLDESRRQCALVKLALRQTLQENEKRRVN